MKKLRKWMEWNRKKRTMACGALALVLCLSVAVMGAHEGKILGGTMGTEESEETGQIPEHDGEVLVDSLNIAMMPGSSNDTVISGSAAVLAPTPAPPPEPSALVTSDAVAEPENTDEYFQELRATVTMDRNHIISMLSDVIAEAESTGEKENATQQKLKIIDYMDKERVIESLIETKGLPACLVLITDNAVNVTVNKQDLTQSDVAKICDIVMRETGRPASQIVIQSKY